MQPFAPRSPSDDLPTDDADRNSVEFPMGPPRITDTGELEEPIQP